MQRVAVITAGIAGVILGVWYFITRSSLSVRKCRDAHGFSRRVLLTAVLVSALASYLVGCARKASTSSLKNTVATNAHDNADHIAVLATMSQWQELKVLWNLLTEDQRVLEKAKDREHLSYSLNGALCRLIVRVRLNEIQQAHVLSNAETTALEGLFATMLSHYCRKHSGSTCYLLSWRGGQIADSRNTIEQQTKLLRKHHREGTLSKELVAKAEEAIAAKLQILDLLNEEDVGLVTEEEIQERVRKWQDEGRVDSLRLDYCGRTKIIEELLAEKDKTLPDEVKAKQRALWERHKSRLTRAIVDLGKYEPGGDPEKVVQKAFEGEGVPLDSIVAYLRNPDNPSREALVHVYAKEAGRQGVHLLQELMQDEEISVSGCEVNSEMVCTITFPVRTAATQALTGMRVKMPDTDKTVCRSNTPEGKTVIKQLLRSRNLKTLGSAIWAAGKSRDKSMIPLLRDIAAKHKELHEDIVRALGDIGHEDALPLLLELADTGNVDGHAVLGSVSDIGGDAATKFLETRMLNSPSRSTQISAVHMLAQTLKKEAIPILLKALEQKDKAYLRVYAGRYLQSLGNNAAVPIAMELVASDDEGVRESAFSILERAGDQASGELLQRLARESKFQNKAIESLISRGGQLAADTFRKTMVSGTEEQKGIVVFQCVNTDFPGAEDLLLDTLKNRSKDLRNRAVYSLGRRGTEKSIPVLCKILTEEPDMEKPVREALRDIVENQCERNCDEIMSRFDASRNKDLSARDLFALLVVGKHDRHGSRSDARTEFAKAITDKAGQRMIVPIIMYFSEYAHDTYDWDFMTYECRDLMEVLDRYPEESIVKIMEFVADPTRMNRELGLGFLAGRGRERKPYALEKIQGLEKLLADCINGSDARVSSEAKRLQCLVKAVPQDRVFAAVLYDLKVPRDRSHALDLLRYEHLMKLSVDQKSQAVPLLLDVLNEIVEKDPMGHLWGAIESAGRLKDKRLAPPLKRFVEKYNPDSADDREPRHVRDAVKVLESLGYEVTLTESGRYRVN